jgi:hypothetical protein
MANRTSKGWFVGFPSGTGISIKAGQPTGVHLQNGGTRGYIDYAGIQDTTDQPLALQIPADADYLRELANTLETMADEIDHK